MSNYRIILSVLICMLLSTVSQHADQPIFNEMPRWDDGWGYQFIHESRHENDLLRGDTVIGPGFSEDVRILHIQGVYTWDKSIRMTAKLPYVLDARRELLADDGSKLTQEDDGIGDLTLALPLKKYFNLDQRTGSWTIAPQLRVPLSSKDEYEIYDGEWGGGLSLGYETETHRYIFAIGASAWYYNSNEPIEVFANIDLALNINAFGSSGHIRMENDLHYEEDGSLTLKSGPAFYWKWTDTVHSKVSWTHDYYDYQGVVDHGNGEQFKVGVGFVF